MLPRWHCSRGEDMPEMARLPSLPGATGGCGLWGGGCGSASVGGDSWCSPQGTQAGPCSPAACPYRLHTVWVLVRAAEEKGRPPVHETHQGECGFGGPRVWTPSSKNAETRAGRWVLPELL